MWLLELSDCSMATPAHAVIDLRGRHPTLASVGYWGDVTVLPRSLFRPDFDCHALCGMARESIKVRASLQHRQSLYRMAICHIIAPSHDEQSQGQRPDRLYFATDATDESGLSVQHLPSLRSV